jgi:peroxiredoxin (alkyl hydroperoxide reductase subunit C)
MLEIGEKSPEINAKAYFPKDDSIKNVKLPESKKWAILTFYPGDFTFVCATDIEALEKKSNDFKKNGADIYAISTDSVFSHKAWSVSSPRAKESTIPLIEDFNKNISKSFGFLNESTGAARRAVAIIDPKGNIQYLAVFNDGLGKDVDHIYRTFMGLKYINDTPVKDGHMCGISAGWKVGEAALDINIVKDIGKL